MLLFVCVVVCLEAYAPKIVASEFDRSLLTVAQVGEGNIVYSYDGEAISPWHDVPFSVDGFLCFVCEIPLGTTAKMEIHKSHAFNPVIQDRHKDGSLRYYEYGRSIVNYGAIAQTWEDPLTPDPDTGLGGDNDPIDVLQLNAKPCPRGAVQRVRVLGALALIDGGETDWKLLVVDVDDLSDPGVLWRDVADVPVHRVHAVREWFRLYKTAEGKTENNYAFGGIAVNATHATRVADLMHVHWRTFVDGRTSCSFNKVACWVGGAHQQKSEGRNDDGSDAELSKTTWYSLCSKTSWYRGLKVLKVPEVPEELRPGSLDSEGFGLEVELKPTLVR
ncbi:hypothetical protein CTAYLR_009694 [Chrysophaeum taylorii]|uniref:inorganic diphosphatase n=1 Tax=Chrysophaeum taylorii TaxID=2483200 RepID=A0AAD7U6X8_9STRA|nr:hypothetical protein CTAYLR_009694 [Chrysophaeum taylorii]